MNFNYMYNVVSVLRQILSHSHIGWIGVLMAVALGMRATIHTTNRASPTQLIVP
jgi:hypothetical protein